MRAAFWKFIATLPTPMQDNISTSVARGESLTAKAFESGYLAALKAQPAPTEARGEDSAGLAAAWKLKPRATADVEREPVARAICKACEENPDHKGDARGNAFRWQDYLHVADAAIAATKVPKP